MNPAIKMALDTVKDARKKADARRIERQAELYDLLTHAKAVAAERAAEAKAKNVDFRADLADRTERVTELVGEQLNTVEKQVKDAAADLEKRAEKGKKRAAKEKKSAFKSARRDAKKLDKRTRKQAKKLEKQAKKKQQALKASAADATKRGKELLGVKEKKKNKGAATAIGLLVTAAVAAVVGYIVYGLFANKLPVSANVPRVDDNKDNAPQPATPAEPAQAAEPVPATEPADEAPENVPGTPVVDSEVPADENPVETKEAPVEAEGDADAEAAQEAADAAEAEAEAEAEASEQDRVVTPINKADKDAAKDTKK